MKDILDLTQTELKGNGLPDHGELNFGILDKDESDQLGLTGFKMFPVHVYELHDDEENWNVITSLPQPPGSLEGVNLANFFSSYYFSLVGKNYLFNNDWNKSTSRGNTEIFFGLNVCP